MFKESIKTPLQDLSRRIAEIPTDKPILVNCASGFRSAAASSMIKRFPLPTAQVYDLGAAVTEYLSAETKK